jgi:hypothetical protein
VAHFFSRLFGSEVPRQPATARLSVEPLGERLLPSAVPASPGGVVAVHAFEAKDFGAVTPTTVESATGGAGTGKAE